MKKLFLIIGLIAFVLQSSAQKNKTDISLFMRSDSTTYLSEKSEKSGDLYSALGHHGPAVENEWIGIRYYFSHKSAIDIYNKVKPGLELKETRWYPTVEQQKQGWGADYYKVGNTVGLGGVHLWDGEKVLELNPVSNRTARVSKEPTCSYLEVLSEDVPYKDTKVDILVRVTVYSGERNAKVEAFALTDEPVQFATGVNYHDNHKQHIEDGLIVTWGIHPEDVAAEIISLGSAIMYNPDDFEKTMDDGKQYLIISKPTKQMATWISSANEKEPEINNLAKFVGFLKQ